MYKHKLEAILGFLGLLMVVLILYQFVIAPTFRISDRPNTVDIDAPRLGSFESIELGRNVYKGYCLACHGAQLEGQPNWRIRNAEGRLPAPPHDEAGHTWHHPDAILFEITKYGPSSIAGDNYESDMPGFEETLSDTEIWQALDYIKSTWPKHIQNEQARRTKTMNQSEQ